jgi:hypothetical protein
MPARQDQTLQIFLIVFIFLFLVSAVVAYLGWKGYGEATQKADGLDGQLKQKQQELTKAQDDSATARQMMGFGPTDSTDSVKEAFDKDMKTFGAGVADEASRSYRKVLEAVFTEGELLKVREAKQKDELKAQAETIAAMTGKHEAQLTSFQKATNDAKQDAANLKNAFAEDRQKLEETKVALQKNLDEQRTTYEKQVTDLTGKLDKTTKDYNKLERANVVLKEQRKDEPGSFEIADGRISSVNQGDGTVWIDLGSADSLRRQVTFSVFNADEFDAAKAEKKGSIEVTRVIGDHLAEARITEDTAANPIIPGDQIYSQVWHRGKKLRFALTGIIDFDGDGQSDMQLAHNLIELNGGSVDAYVKEDGKVEGEITPNTRYLVLGEFPTSSLEANQSAAWQSMNKEAAAMGVENITIPEFLAQMGYKPQDRTVQLGAGAAARDFPARSPGAYTPVMPRQRFRPRTPVRTHNPALPSGPTAPARTPAPPAAAPAEPPAAAPADASAAPADAATPPASDGAAEPAATDATAPADADAGAEFGVEF